MTAGITFSNFLREDRKQTYDPGSWVNDPDGKSPWTGK